MNKEKSEKNLFFHVRELKIQSNKDEKYLKEAERSYHLQVLNNKKKSRDFFAEIPGLKCIKNYNFLYELN